MLKTALAFGDRMVLQREKTVAVWGTAEPSETVEVWMQGKRAAATSDTDGNWIAYCGPYETSFEETMTVRSGTEQLTFSQVQVGEVWLAGGQSNMEFHMRYDADFPSEQASCKNDNIRFFDYPEVSYVGQIDEADYTKEYGRWRRADPENLERFSAVGYYFARELQARLKVPVGIIGCNWGGTPACAWMSEEAIREGGGQIYLEEYAAALQKLDLEAYEAQFRQNPMSYQTDLLANPISDMMMFGCTPETFAAKLAELGVDLSNMAALLPSVGPKYERRPSGLYESMLGQLVPYALRGFLYYQGETDGDTHPACYKTLFPALIRNWRELWREELPFLFVQIAPLERWMDCVGEHYVAIREAQQHTADTVPGTGMAVITDVGMQHDIHPKKKQPVGYRLALLAEKQVYGQEVLAEAPTLIDAELREGELILRFAHAGDGLSLRERLPYGQSAQADRLGGLQVFRDGQLLEGEHLCAAVEGDRVILRSEQLRAEAETEVRLAKTGWYLVNLYNSAGLPARPGCVKAQRQSGSVLK